MASASDSQQAVYRAVIFDMDGVLADSEPIYHYAMQLMLTPLGKQITPTQQRDMMGKSIEDTWAYLANAFSLEGPLDALIDAYDQELRRQLALVRDTLPGVRELLGALKQRGVPMAVASSSLPEWIDALLGGLGLQGTFDAAVSARQAAHPKPAPDVYLLAAERLGIDPNHCIAVEDSPTGLASAKAAAMFTVQSRAASTAFP
ncbi:MAG TPA: HAD family phosphatase, partial [Dehalococcoidia bacterium]|nr:HAD family phosphatase [Dehalococcoidia bacterium]